MAAWLDIGGDVEVASDESSTHVADLVPVDPDSSRVVYAAKVQPCMPALIGGGKGKAGALPVAGLVQALRNGTNVFPIERFRIDLVVDQRGQHGSRNSRGVPAFRFKVRQRHRGWHSRDFGGILEFPSRDRLLVLLSKGEGRHQGRKEKCF